MPELWRRRFAGRPTVLFFDDLHWSDPASIALLQHVLPLVEDMSLVFMCAFRPERDAPGWRIKSTADEAYRHRYTEVSLRPLTPEHSRQMVNRLLGDPEMPAGLLNRILERAGGNPFFIEEVIRSLIVRGALVAEDGTGKDRIWRVSDAGADIDIPGNLQSLLTARIDSLSEETRQTLQVASVVGRNFYRRVLALVDKTSAELDAHIQTLLRQEMIRETARIPEVEYSFSNPLTQEAAYGTILLKRRRSFHRRVGEAMETLFPDRLGELGPQLAYHFREGRDFERALGYYRQAGDTAYRLYANAEAVTQYGLALEMAGQWESPGRFEATSQVDPAYLETLLHVYGRRGRALEHLLAHERALENYRAMAEHAQKLDDRPLALAAMIAKATLYSTATGVQDSALGKELSEEALDIALELGDRAAEAKIYWNLMNSVVFSGGDTEEGLTYGRASLEIARELDLREQIAYTLGGMALLYMNADRIREAQAMMPEVSAIWRELDNKPMLADSYALPAVGRIYFQGDYAEGIPLAQEMEQISQSINNAWNLMAAKSGLGVAFMRLGELGQSIGYLEQTLALAEEAGNVANVVTALTFLAEANSTLGANDRAHTLAGEALGRYAEVPPFLQTSHLASQASIFVHLGDLDQARRILGELLTNEVKTRNNAWEASLVAGAEADLALAEERPGNAISHLESTIPRLQEVDVRAELPRLLHLRGKAHLAMGKGEAAVIALKEALAESRNTGEKLWRWRILAALLPFSQGDGAAQWRDEAVETVEFISEHAGSEELSRSFRQRADVATLLGTPARE
jgi:tetratricopeptide (TPR) repeat protein